MLIQAERQNQDFPLLSKITALREEEAYQVQKIFVGQKDIAGFKLGLTSKLAQTVLGISTPVVGVLLNSGKKTAEENLILALGQQKERAIEMEIGFVVGVPIHTALATQEEWMSKVKAIVPIIELPSLRFKEVMKITAIDMIASNVGSDLFIVGRQGDKNQALKTLKVELKKEGKAVLTGRGEDAMKSDPKLAAFWLANAVIGRGWVISENQILITGALGGIYRGGPGHYEADFSELGKISFFWADPANKPRDRNS